MSKKMLFVFNPHSGKGMIKNHLVDIIDTFVKGGYEVTVRPTQERGDLRKQILAHSSEYDVITVSGGDGTINEAAGAMLELPPEKRTVIGCIPAGSTNDFVTNLAIPSDMRKAAELIVNGKVYDCDMGMFNDKPFVYVAAAGILADVSYDTPQGVKNIFGHSAYIFEAMKRLPTLTPFDIKIRCGDKVREGSYIMFMILNSTRVGGIDIEDFIPADISDGIFEAVLIEMPESLISFDTALKAVLRGEEKGPGFEVIRGSEFEIESYDKIRWTLDGEFGGDSEKIGVRVIHGAVKIIGENRE